MAGLAQHHDAAQVTAFLPRADAAWLPVRLFLIYIAVQWWAQYFSDGSGYLAQRLFTARNDAHAEGGALWFACANYALRTWPWVLVALAALVIFPLGGDATGSAAIVAADREMAYPILMRELLPTGLLGLMVASLLAAFMSTVDTHINWGTSYIVNDLYRRFLRPRASDAELIAVSRVTVFLLALMAILIAARISSIESAWRFFIALGAGLGLPSMLRWLWWRVNAWTEIVGMIAAVIMALILYPLFPDARDEYLLLAIIAVSMTAAMIATVVTDPVPDEQLTSFTRRVRPPGAWRRLPGSAPRAAVAWIAIAWVAGNTAVFALMFGIGHILLARPLTGILMTATGAAAAAATLKPTRTARRLTPA
jgi:Na+/proline symporter